MSENNRVKLCYCKEEDWGVTPGSPAWKTLRHTDQSFRHSIDTIVSSEVRSDRAQADTIASNKYASGGFNFELSALTFDDLIEGAMCNTWNTAGTPANQSITLNASQGGTYIDGSVESGALTTKLGADIDYGWMHPIWKIVTTTRIPQDAIITKAYFSAYNATPVTRTFECKLPNIIRHDPAISYTLSLFDPNMVEFAIDATAAERTFTGVGSCFGESQTFEVSLKEELQALIDEFGAIEIGNNILIAAITTGGFDSKIEFYNQSNFPTFTVEWIALPAWSGGTATLNELCTPTTPNGYYYKCTTGGAQGASEPASWGTDYLSVTADGTARWTCMGPSTEITNGATANSYHIEKRLEDKDKFFLYTGMMVNTMSLNIATGQPITGSFDFTGKIPTIAIQDTAFAASPAAATVTEVMNAIGNVGTLYEGGSALTGIHIRDLSIQINNNLRSLPAIGSDSAVAVTMGTFEVTGTINMYFENATLYTKFLNNTITSLSFTVTKGANQYLFVFPRIKFESDQDSGGGLNTDLMEQIQWRALYDSTEGCQMIIKKM